MDVQRESATVVGNAVLVKDGGDLATVVRRVVEHVEYRVPYRALERLSVGGLVTHPPLEFGHGQLVDEAGHQGAGLTERGDCLGSIAFHRGRDVIGIPDRQGVRYQAGVRPETGEALEPQDECPGDVFDGPVDALVV